MYKLGEQGGNRGTGGEQGNSGTGGARFYTQKLLHTASFYTQKFLHTEAFAHSDATTPGSLCTQQAFILHTEPYTPTLLHTEAFTHKSRSTATLWHAEACAHCSNVVSKNSTHTDLLLEIETPDAGSAHDYVDDDDDEYEWRCIPCTGESGHPVHQRAKIPCTRGDYPWTI